MNCELAVSVRVVPICISYARKGKRERTEEEANANPLPALSCPGASVMSENTTLANSFAWTIVPHTAKPMPCPRFTFRNATSSSKHCKQRARAGRTPTLFSRDEGKPANSGTTMSHLLVHSLSFFVAVLLTQGRDPQEINVFQQL